MICQTCNKELPKYTINLCGIKPKDDDIYDYSLMFVNPEEVET